MIDPNSYSIMIRKVTTDNESQFEATVAELPDVVVYSDTYDDAYQSALHAIQDLAALAAERNRPFPVPRTIPDDYSGRVTLRMAPSMHRIVAELSDRAHLSLNQFLVTAIAYYCGAVENQAPYEMMRTDVINLQYASAVNAKNQAWGTVPMTGTKVDWLASYSNFGNVAFVTTGALHGMQNVPSIPPFVHTTHGSSKATGIITKFHGGAYPVKASETH